jgi:ATP-dependent exoDNAse (exonuclease V) beta subunit
MEDKTDNEKNEIVTLRSVDNKDLLSFKNAHKNDSRIRFQELGHKYWIDEDDTNIVSCTTYIHQFFGEFDSDGIIKSILKSKKWKTDNTYKYYKKTYDDIKKMWDDNAKEASNLGTIMHAKIEHFYNDLEVEYTDECVDFLQFLDFYSEHENLEMFRTEWVIFAEDLRITGSIDAVFKNEDGTVTLGDWKRSKQINFKAFKGDMANHPFEYLEDCNYIHYCLQLNLYRVILEKYYDLKIKEMFLGVFHPDNKDGKFLKINIPIMVKEGEMLLEYRKKQLENL